MAKKQNYMPRYLIIDFASLYSYKTAKLPDLKNVPEYVKIYDVRDGLEYDTSQDQWFTIIDFDGFD